MTLTSTIIRLVSEVIFTNRRSFWYRPDGYFDR